MTIVGKLKNSPHVEKFQYNWWGFIAIYVTFEQVLNTIEHVLSTFEHIWTSFEHI